MSGVSKLIGTLAGGSFGTFLSVIIIWVLVDPGMLALNMPEVVQAAVSGLVTTTFGAIATYYAPANKPPA